MKVNKHIIAITVCGLFMASGAALAEEGKGPAEGPNSMTTNPGMKGGTQGTGGVVHFTGKITDVSCDVSQESTGQTVDLGAWAKSYFKSQKETTLTPFSIKVQNCPESVKKVAVLFDGEKDARDQTLLKVTSGEASGVGIKLYEENRSTAIDIGKVSDKQTLETAGGSTGTTELKFFADYRANGDEIKTGDAKADANFLMVYN